jgi:hypothetical protein
MNAEDRLSELMDAATRALNPPLEAMLEEGERRGRRRRRIRRAAVAAGTAAVVLLAAGGAALAERATDRPQYNVGLGPVIGKPTAGATPSPRLSTPATADSAQTPSPVSTSTQGLIPINSAAAVNILKRLVAAKWKFMSYDPTTTGALTFAVDDGQGLAQIFVAVQPAAASGMDAIDCTEQTALIQGGGKRPVGAVPASCVVRTYTNGDKAMQEVLKADAYGQYQYRIIVSRADGVAVEITAANGSWQSAATEVTRPRPPLSAAQWTTVALNPAWQPRMPVTPVETASATP